MQRTIMVTGATSGIGKETARELAIRGAQVAVVGRNESKAEATEIRYRPKVGSGSGISFRNFRNIGPLQYRRQTGRLQGCSRLLQPI